MQATGVTHSAAKAHPLQKLPLLACISGLAATLWRRHTWRHSTLQLLSSLPANHAPAHDDEVTRRDIKGDEVRMLRPARVGVVPELQWTSKFVLHLCTKRRQGNGRDPFGKQEAGNRWQD